MEKRLPYVLILAAKSDRQITDAYRLGQITGNEQLKRASIYATFRRADAKRDLAIEGSDYPCR